MRVSDAIDTGLVQAARAGDRQAVDELVTASLPLVYTVVRQALDGHPDADDVVQDVMLRALRQLPALRKPDSYRSWLIAITVNQIGTHLHRRATGSRRAVPLDEAGTLPDPGLEVENLSTLRAELSAQRRQVVRAGRWLDPDDRTLLSLWLLEVAGELTRTDVAAALATSVAHTGVRIQRMRQQLDAARELVAALDARPRCPELDAATAGWDGTPAPLWRKRLIRHTRSCDVCQGSTAEIVAAERLLPQFATLLPVPMGLTSAVLGNSAVTAPAVFASAGAGVKAGILGQLLQTVLAHPVVATVAAGALVTGTAVTVTTWPAPPPVRGPAAAPSVAVTRPPVTPRFSVSPAPSASATTAAGPTATPTASLTAGRPVSVESAERPGRFVATDGDLGVLTPAGPGNRQATFTAVAGLSDPRCFSFRAADGRYLRHASWRLRLDTDQGTPLFRGDATFCTADGPAEGTVALEAQNYPGWFLHHRGDELWVDQTDGSTTFRTETSFRIRPALA